MVRKTPAILNRHLEEPCIWLALHLDENTTVTTNFGRLFRETRAVTRFFGGVFHGELRAAEEHLE